MSWNRPSGAPQPQPKKSASPSLKRGLLAGLAVVLGAGSAAWLLSSGEATSSSLQKKDRGLIKSVKPTRGVVLSQEGSINAVDSKVDAVLKDIAKSIGKDDSANVTTPTNGDYDVGIEASRKVKELGITAVDQLINMATTAPEGLPPPPLPVNPGSRLRNRLAQKAGGYVYQHKDGKALKIVNCNGATDKAILANAADSIADLVLVKTVIADGSFDASTLADDSAGAWVFVECRSVLFG